VVVVLLALALLTTQPLVAGGRESRGLDAKSKAALIFNFAKFVEWPGEKLGYQKELVICVMGDESLGEILERSAEGKSIRDMEIRVESGVSPGSIRDCHILVIGDADSDDIERMLDSLRGRPVLTIGDDPQFNNTGGIIQLMQGGSNMRFQVNLGWAAEADLHVSSKLLQLAVSVNAKKRFRR
jgi:hypothetical protein